VFLGGRFDTVPANGIDADSLARAAPAFRRLPLVGPRVVGARKPADAGESSRIMGSAMVGGPDVQHLPHLYVPYAELATEAANAAKPLVTLAQKGRAPSDQVTDFVAVNGRAGRSLGFVPVRARNRDFAAVVDRKTGEVVGYLVVEPW